jgi:hypothetical protein
MPGKYLDVFGKAHFELDVLSDASSMPEPTPAATGYALAWQSFSLA